MDYRNQFYVYLYRDPKDDRVIYVGKGQQNRAWTHLRRETNSHLHRLIKKRLEEGFKIEPEILVYGSEEYAHQVEITLIAQYGREDLNTGTLFNLTDGGEGATGAKRSEETVQRLKESHKDRDYSKVFSQEVRERMSKAHLGHTHTEETRGKIINALTGRAVSEETRNKISQAQKGREKTPEELQKIKEGISKMSPEAKSKWRQRVSDSKKGQVVSEATRKKLSQIHTGQKRSIIARKHMSEAAKGRQPWDTSLAKSSGTRTYWKYADKAYELWKHHGYGDSKIKKFFDIQSSSRVPWKTMVEKFKDGWIPSNDPEWVKFSETSD